METGGVQHAAETTRDGVQGLMKKREEIQSTKPRSKGRGGADGSQIVGVVPELGTYLGIGISRPDAHTSHVALDCPRWAGLVVY
ncbi:hypothetical protein CHU98_g970 [Xylaria longipes]|nr:hypothetical protein CHU98_g970 [Xylaria longipes]